MKAVRFSSRAVKARSPRWDSSSEALIGRLIANQLAQASFAAADRAGDRVELAQPLLGGLGGGVEPSQRRRRLLDQVAELDGPLGGDGVELGEGGCVGPAGRQLDDLGADHALGDDPGDGVGADQVPEPLIDPQNQLHRLARLGGRDDPLDHAGVNPLKPDAMADLESADRLELRPDAKGRLHLPLPAGHLVKAETRQSQHRHGKPRIGQRPPSSDVASHRGCSTSRRGCHDL